MKIFCYFRLIIAIFITLVVVKPIGSIVDEHKITRIVKSIESSVVYLEVNTLVETENRIRQEVFKKNGLIISSDGYILTSFISSEIISNIKVFIDSKEYIAQLIGNDKTTRISVIKISPDKKLTPVRFASKPPKEGQWLVGIYVLAEEYQFRKMVQYCMVTTIIPSGKLNSLYLSTNVAYDGMLLANMNNEIVGVILPFYELRLSVTDTQDRKVRNEIDMMRAELRCVSIEPIIKSAKHIIKKQDNIEISWIGVGIEKLSKIQAKGLGISHNGILVTKVFKESPAKKAGLAPKDVIFEIDRNIIPGNSLGLKLFIDTVRSCEPGKEMNIKIRRGKLEKTLTIKPKKFPDPKKIKSLWLGLTVIEVDDTLYNVMNLFVDKGILIVDIEPGSSAAHAKLEPGDLITHIQSAKVTEIDKWQNIVNQLQTEDIKYVSIKLYRGNKTLTRVIKPALGRAIK